ncbi:uridylate kinase [Planctomycetota bacterium]|nr:uridylate kinase [Planctomycetota bacterium]
MPVPRLLKLSGEALGTAEAVFDHAVVERVCGELAGAVAAGARAAIVVGGGNILRGASVKARLRVPTRGDDMGMLATLINAVMLKDALERAGAAAVVVAPHAIPGIAAVFDQDAVNRHLAAGTVIVFGGGTGHPFFTTDTAAALRAAQIGADELLKASTIDGVYTADPKRDPSARRLDRLSFDEAIAKRYGVMDLAAFALCRESKVAVRVFDMRTPGAIAAAFGTQPPGTLVHP